MFDFLDKLLFFRKNKKSENAISLENVLWLINMAKAEGKSYVEVDEKLNRYVTNSLLDKDYILFEMEEDGKIRSLISW